MQMKHEENLMERQTMVSDPEGFSRIGGVNYSDTEHLLSTLEARVSTQTTDCSIL